MKKRKSPRRHHVKNHTRKGKRVRDYYRGKGVKINPFTKKKIQKDFIAKNELGYHELREYTVVWQYGTGKHVSTETVKVEAHSVPEAILHADKLRKRQSERPTGVIAHNLLGEIVGRLAAWGVGGIKKAIQTYKMVRAKARPGEKALEAKVREAETGEAGLPIAT